MCLFVLIFTLDLLGFYAIDLLPVICLSIIAILSQYAGVRANDIVNGLDEVFDLINSFFTKQLTYPLCLTYQFHNIFKPIRHFNLIVSNIIGFRTVCLPFIALIGLYGE